MESRKEYSMWALDMIHLVWDRNMIQRVWDSSSFLPVYSMKAMDKHIRYREWDTHRSLPECSMRVKGRCIRFRVSDNYKCCLVSGMSSYYREWDTYNFQLVCSNLQSASDRYTRFLRSVLGNNTLHSAYGKEDWCNYSLALGSSKKENNKLLDLVELDSWLVSNSTALNTQGEYNTSAKYTYFPAEECNTMVSYNGGEYSRWVLYKYHQYKAYSMWEWCRVEGLHNSESYKYFLLAEYNSMASCMGAECSSAGWYSCCEPVEYSTKV